MPKGLIDQQEVLAFALCDGLGRPLLPHGDARAVGQAADDAMCNMHALGPLPVALRFSAAAA